jgi:hypothetical protein
MIHLLNNTGK